jgi:hypothetical protein
MLLFIEITSIWHSLPQLPLSLSENILIFSLADCKLPKGRRPVLSLVFPTSAPPPASSGLKTRERVEQKR